MMWHYFAVCVWNSIQVFLPLKCVWFGFSMFKKDELKLDLRQGKGWACVTGENPDEISLLTNQQQEHKIQEDSKKGRGCNLRVKGIKS